MKDKLKNVVNNSEPHSTQIRRRNREEKKTEKEKIHY